MFGIILFAGLSFYADFDAVVSSLKRFSILFILSLLVLSFMNYTTRFLKWQFYLFTLRIKIKTKDSFLIFLSGLVMSVTPGKFGEVLKSLILKQHYELQISRTAPIIIAERVTDLMSLVLIAAIGTVSFHSGETVLILTSLFLLILITVLSHKKLFEIIIQQISKIDFFNKHLSQFNNIHESFWILLKFKNILLMSLLSIAAWFFECFAFYLILTKFDINFSLNAASFIYSFSTIVGSILLLPGGLGGTEGTMTFLLLQNGFPKDVSVASIMLIRVITLWFAVIVGVVSFALYQKYKGKITL